MTARPGDTVLTIRIVTPVALTDEQGEAGYYAALNAVADAIPDLSNEERDRMAAESGCALGPT